MATMTTMLYIVRTIRVHVAAAAAAVAAAVTLKQNIFASPSDGRSALCEIPAGITCAVRGYVFNNIMRARVSLRQGGEGDVRERDDNAPGGVPLHRDGVAARW